MQEDKLVVPSVRVCKQSSINILRCILKIAGNDCTLTVFSYSVTDGWLRQLLKLKNEMQVKLIRIVLDRDVMIRHRHILKQLENVADEIYLTDSHAKVYLATNHENEVAVITSANATQNHRNECYYATDRRPELQRIKDDVSGILANAFKIK